MKVADLIEELKKLPQDSVVVQSSDAEGNTYSPIAAVAAGFYHAETGYSGGWSEQDHYDQANMTREEYVAEYFDGDKGVPAVCIWPTN